MTCLRHSPFHYRSWEEGRVARFACDRGGAPKHFNCRFMIKFKSQRNDSSKMKSHFMLRGSWEEGRAARVACDRGGGLKHFNCRFMIKFKSQRNDSSQT
jgi:hypothetical protein